MHIVKSFGVMSVAKIMGVTYACMGLLFAPLFLLFGLLGSMVRQENSPFAGIVGVVIAVLLPFFYGAVGFIGGAIGALLYNLFAKWVGGFEVEVELRPTTPVAPYPIIPAATPSI
ncbi:MAG: hypothetical protein WBQ08_12085 [Candidatus Sulfotelmatobacter sp.]